MEGEKESLCGGGRKSIESKGNSKVKGQVGGPHGRKEKR
jgi:hypothetical protein